jgi:hypothetical protein
MKKLFTILILALSLTTANAQMPDGSIAPNWTLSDINGTSHTLYNLLDSGYVVFLDFSATWCGPCWNYHNSHAFRDLYNQYGPGTSANKVRVFMVEGDASTTSSDLVGTGSNTWGDWTAGVPYPIIDNSSLTSPYQIGYWPTIYKICPSRVISEVGQLGTAGLWAEAQVADCQPASMAVDALIQSYDGGTTLCGTGTADMEVTIMNFGINPLTSATINVLNGASTISSTNWTGNLATYASASVNLGALSLPSTANVTFQVVATGDGNASNNSIDQEILVAAQTPNDTFFVQIQTDQYGYETYWAIVDDMGNIAQQADGSLAHGGNTSVGLNGGGAQTATSAGPGAYAGNTLINRTIVVPQDGCYEFVMVDDWGDGICCNYGNGYYNLYDSDYTLLVTGSAFTTSAFAPYEAMTAANTNETIALEGVKVFPNPASTVVNIQFNLTSTQDMNVSISNALGQTVREVNTGNLNAGLHNFTVNTADLAAGMYFINFTDGQNVVTQRFVVAK